MKCLGWVFLGCLTVASCSYTPAQTAPSVDDPFDLSATDAKVQELGVPTVQSVDQLERRATELYTSEKWNEAESALDEYAKQANWLSNLIAGGLQPYYDASYDDRESFPHARLLKLIPLESLGNQYKEKRNRAMVMRAECFVNLGQTEKAVSLLVGALDLIDIEDEKWWTRATDQLYSIIGVQ